VWDIGANTGKWATIAKQHGHNVIAVEPNPAHLPHLAGIADHVIHAAISTRPHITLHVADDTGLGSSDRSWVLHHMMHRQTRHPITQWSPPTTRLDELAHTYGPPAFIKIDTEGAERDVLDTWHQQHLPTVSVEYHGGLYPIGGPDASVNVIDYFTHPRWSFRFAEEETRWVTPWLPQHLAARVVHTLSWGDLYIKAGAR